MLSLLKMFKSTLEQDSKYIYVSSVDTTRFTGDWMGYLKFLEIPIELHPLILAYNNITSDKLTHDHNRIKLPNLDALRDLIKIYGLKHPI